jgi:hypothetical protein
MRLGGKWKIRNGVCFTFGIAKQNDVLDQRRPISASAAEGLFGRFVYSLSLHPFHCPSLLRIL